MKTKALLVHTQYQLNEAVRAGAGPLRIEAYEPIEATNLMDAMVTGGTVTLRGDCDVTVKGDSVVYAHDGTRLTVPGRSAKVIVYAHDYAEVEAYDGYTYGRDYARLFLHNRASAEVYDRALALAAGQSVVTIAGGAPTVRTLGGLATVNIAQGMEYTLS